MSVGHDASSSGVIILQQDVRIDVDEGVEDTRITNGSRRPCYDHRLVAAEIFQQNEASLNDDDATKVLADNAEYQISKAQAYTSAAATPPLSPPPPSLLPLSPPLPSLPPLSPPPPAFLLPPSSSEDQGVHDRLEESEEELAADPALTPSRHLARWLRFEAVLQAHKVKLYVAVCVLLGASGLFCVFNLNL